MRARNQGSPMTAYSYETYRGWSFAVPISIITFGSFTNFLVLPLLYLCLKEKKSLSKPFIRLLFMYSKIVFRGSLKWKEVGSGFKIYLHDYEILSRPDVVFQFSTVATLSLCCIFIAFWASFLINQTFVCDPSMDCFVMSLQSHTKFPEPVEDCASVRSNTLVECFEFVFDTSMSVASCSGFLTLVVGYSYVLNYLLVFFLHLAITSGTRAVKLCASFGWICTLILPMLFVIIACIMVSVLLLFLRDIFVPSIVYSQY